MRKAILFTTVVGTSVAHNIGVLTEGITVEDFMTAYTADKTQAMELIVEMENNVIPAKIYALATEELVSVKKIILDNVTTNQDNVETKKIPAVLAITQNGNVLIHDVFAVAEQHVNAFVSTWKNNTAEAISKYATSLLTVDRADIDVVDWVLINVTPKKTKKRSAKDVEADLQGVDLGTVTVTDEPEFEQITDLAFDEC